MRPIERKNQGKLRNSLFVLILTCGWALGALPQVGTAATEGNPPGTYSRQPIMFKDWTEIRDTPGGQEKIVREQERQGEYFRRWQAVHELVGHQHTSRLSRQLLKNRGLGTALFDKSSQQADKAFDGTDTLKVLIVRIGFETNRDTALTTVDPSGDFVLELPENLDDLLVDPPPRNRDFYESHLVGLSEYYNYQSGGRLHIEGTVLPEEQNGSYKLTDIADYGPGAGAFWSMESLEALVRDVIQVGDAGTAGSDYDFSDFDDDDPLTYIIFVHAGSDWQSDINGDSPNDIPTFFVALGEPQNLVSGGSLSECSIIPETTSTDGRLGSIAAAFYHEFGHALGLPDVYNTTTGYPSVGIWDLMDSGTNLPVTLGHITAENDTIIKAATGVLPPSLSVWNKWFLGWVEMEEVDGRSSDYMLPAVQVPYSQYPMWDAGFGDFNESYPQAIRIGSSPREFFLLENRYVPPAPDVVGGTYTPYFGLFFEKDDATGVIQYLSGERPVGYYSNSGMYDYFMPNGGVLVWHVNMDRIASNLADNTINGFGDGLRLVESDGIQDIGVLDAYVLGWYGSDRDPFGNNNESKELFVDGVPSSRNFDRSWSGASLTDIRPDNHRSSSVMRFGAQVVPVNPGFPWQVSSVTEDEASAAGGQAGSRQLDSASLTPVQVGGQSLLVFADAPGHDWSGDDFPASLMAIRADGSSPYSAPANKPEGAILTLDSPLAGAPLVLDASSDSPQVVYGTRQGTLGCIEFPASGEPVPLWSLSVGDSMLYAPVIGRDDNGAGFVVCVTAPDSMTASQVSDGSITFSANLPHEVIGQPAVMRSNEDRPYDTLLLPLTDGLQVNTFHHWEGTAVHEWAREIAGPVHTVVPNDDSSDQWYIALDDLGVVPTVGLEGNVQVFFDGLNSPLVCEPAVADVDADGRSDVVLATSERIFVYHTDGTFVRGFPRKLYDLFPLPDFTRISGPLVVVDGTGDGVNEIYFNTDGGHLVGLNATGELLPQLPFKWGDTGSAGLAMSAGPTIRNQLYMVSSGGTAEFSVGRSHANGRLVTYGLTSDFGATNTTSQWLGTMGSSERLGAFGEAQNLDSIAPISAEMKKVTLYPNPVHESDLTVRYYAYSEGTALIVLYNLQGEEITRGEFATTAQAINENQLDVSGLVSGLYLGRLVFPGENGTETKTMTLAVER